MLKTSHWANLKKVLAQDGINVSKPLYHSTSLDNARKIIREGFKARAGGPKNDAYHDNSVCFTRNLEFAKAGSFGASQIIFVLDEHELKQRFQTYSFDYIAINMPKSPRKEPFTHEYETRVSRTPGKYIPKYNNDNDNNDFCLLETTIGSKYIKAILVRSYAYGEPLQDVNISGKATYIYSKNSYYRYEKKAPEDFIPNLSLFDRKELASSHYTDSKTLSLLSYDNNAEVRVAVASNPNVSYDTLKILATDELFGVLLAIAHNKKTPATLLQTIVADDTLKTAGVIINRIIKLAAIENPNITSDILEFLAQDKQDAVRAEVAGHPITPVSALEKLSRDESPDIRYAITSHGNISNAILKRLTQDPEDFVSEAATYYLTQRNVKT